VRHNVSAILLRAKDAMRVAPSASLPRQQQMLVRPRSAVAQSEFEAVPADLRPKAQPCRLGATIRFAFEGEASPLYGSTGGRIVRLNENHDLL